MALRSYLLFAFTVLAGMLLASVLMHLAVYLVF
jgi:hypothetical protein